VRKKMDFAVKIGAALCLLAYAAGTAFGQDEGELTAKRRLFPGVGPGLRTVKRGADGRVYVLASPAPGLVVFDSAGKQVLSIGAPVPEAAGKSAGTPITFGEDCDVDTEGRIYVADRGANRILIFSKDGALLRSIAVPSPVSIAAMPEGEVGVATLHEPHLVIVFDKNGRDVREFGDPEAISERAELNRFLNIGELAADDQGHLYYAFEYFPEPTVRQYDRFGYSQLEIRYTAIEALTTARAVRREIDRQERRGDTPTFKRGVLTAVGVDRASGEVWVALQNTLLHFDKDGNRRANYQLYTPQGARLEANTILVEKERLIIGSDPLGAYEFERPTLRVKE
jgi:hypothetical protein